jgi:hypothetical protein
MDRGVIRTQGGSVLTGFERRVEVVRRRFESGGEEAIHGRPGAKAFSPEQTVTSAAKAAVFSGEYCGTAEAVPLSKTVDQRGGPGAVMGAIGEYRDPSPSAQDDNSKLRGDVFNPLGHVVPMKKLPQRAGVGVWQSRPTWAGER